jgi:hypothetical protein
MKTSFFIPAFSLLLFQSCDLFTTNKIYSEIKICNDTNDSLAFFNFRNEGEIPSSKPEILLKNRMYRVDPHSNAPLRTHISIKDAFQKRKGYKFETFVLNVDTLRKYADLRYIYEKKAYRIYSFTKEKMDSAEWSIRIR